MKKLNEGVDLNYLRKTVAINLTHDEGVDMTIEMNPMIYNLKDYDGKLFNVVSIFLRKDILGQPEDYDGNPLMYAINNTRGWHFEDRKKQLKILINRFYEICDNIDPVYDTLICIPSTSALDNIFIDPIKKALKFRHYIENIFVKPTLAEVKLCHNFNVLAKQIGYSKTQKIIDQFNEDFSRMKTKYFEIKHIREENRKYLKLYDFQCMLYDKSSDYDDVCEYINDKHVVLFDDFVSRGSTISMYANNFLKLFYPKKLTIITLLSARNAKPDMILKIK
jgi:hypothetical protein